MTDEPTERSAAVPDSIRGRLGRALAGEPIDWPVYAVYDWFVQNRPIDWPSLFAQGLGQVNHATVVELERPNLEIVETACEQDGRTRRDVRWVTDAGELHEWFLGEWRQEHLVKRPEDYRVARRAFEGARPVLVTQPFAESEAAVGEGGITLGQIGPLGTGRTPLLAVQIDVAGLERFSLDLATKVPELMDLLDAMSDLTLESFRVAAGGPAEDIKLWENLSIDTLGPRVYQRHLVPLYEKILDILAPSGKRLHVHYDGKLGVISQAFAALDIYGVDSFTPPPEGDMSLADGRAAWRDKFLWVHPSLSWFHEDAESLSRRVLEAAAAVGPRRFCFLLSEEVPPNWREGIPAVLDALAGYRD